MNGNNLFLKRIAETDIFNDEGCPTKTSFEQEQVETDILKNLRDFEEFLDIEPVLNLRKSDHIAYLRKGLSELPVGYECLDASRPWLCYWIVHSLSILGEPIGEETKSKICGFLAKCQSESGGFGGGPGQLAHLAPTYAAVNCLCILGTNEAYNVVDREALLLFLKEMRQKDGSFAMHVGGECDTRSLYCALSVASLMGILDVSSDLFENSAQWIVSCQTYEGGIAGYPGTEAHGGYTFCGYAALVILGHEKLIDTERLLTWVVNRQMKVEGGFQGRTNKLVDGCYSFWQGGLLPLLHSTLVKEGCEDRDNHWLFNQEALQEYLLINCQSQFGGLRDKPGKSTDYYHTCYCLSGLAVSQHNCDGSITILGNHENKVNSTHPVFNISWHAEKKARTYFKENNIIGLSKK